MSWHCSVLSIVAAFSVLEGTSTEMEVIVKTRRRRERKVSPFRKMLDRTERVFDEATKKEWMDDLERRLRDILSRVHPKPRIRGYSVERSGEGISIHTISAKRIARREVGLLSSGQWPCWSQIVRAVPEFDQSRILFDAESEFEWSRTWDVGFEHGWFMFEHGIYC